MFYKSQYFWRTYLGYVVVALIGTFLFSAVLTVQVNRKAVQSLDNDLQVTSEMVAMVVTRPMLNLNYPEVREKVAEIFGQVNLRITVIDSNGLVLADSHEDPYVMNNHLRRPEVQLAILNGTGSAQRYSYTLHEDYRYLARAVYSDGKVAGFVRVAKAVSALRRDIQEQQISLVRDAAVIAFVVLLLAFYLAGRQAAKVEELTSVAEVISRGDFERRVSEGNALGLKRLGEAVNKMARSSAARVTEITSDRNRLTTIFTCMVEGVIDVDLDQKVLHINEAASRMLEVEENNCLGKPVWQEIRNREIINALDEAIKTHSVIKTQMRLDKSSGQMVMDIYAASLTDDNGVPIGAVLVLHDITELKNLERVRSDFVANASHELKTPITAIRGLSETILGDMEVDQKTLVHFMDRVHAQSLRLSQLVGDLMTISRLEASQNSDDFVSINLTDLVNQAVNTARATAQEKGHKLESDILKEKLVVHGDRQNLSQLVDNLIDNAIKYTPEPGQISVSLRREEDAAVLDVQDTGIGISPQYQQRVFERFYRVDKARSQSLGGTGLGLSIVKNIAEKHGGSVSVKSQLGSGSTFSFRIPLEDPDAEQG